MARPEKPLEGPQHRVALAARLREMRAATGATYEEMAALSRRLLDEKHHVSSATLKRTASGLSVPTWYRVRQFHAICFLLADAPASPELRLAGLRTLWLKARMEERGTLHVRKPRPEFVVDKADLSYALYTLYEHSGAPPLREMERRAGGSMHLPVSTLVRIVARETLPADERQFLAFLNACRVPENDLDTWRRAWRKVARRRFSLTEMNDLDLTEEISRIERKLFWLTHRSMNVKSELGLGV